MKEKKEKKLKIVKHLEYKENPPEAQKTAWRQIWDTLLRKSNKEERR